MAPDVGEDCQVQPSKAPAQVKKSNPRNRQPKRIPQYNNTRKPSRMTTMCLSNELSWMSPSTEVTFDPVSYERGGEEIIPMDPYS